MASVKFHFCNANILQKWIKLKYSYLEYKISLRSVAFLLYMYPSQIIRLLFVSQILQLVTIFVIYLYVFLFFFQNFDSMDSGDFNNRLGSARKTMRSLENHSDDSETSSVCSERSFDSFRRPSEVIISHYHHISFVCVDPPVLCANIDFMLCVARPIDLFLERFTTKTFKRHVGTYTCEYALFSCASHILTAQIQVDNTTLT